MGKRGRPAGEVLERHHESWTGGKNHRALDQVLEFANVSGPPVAAHHVEGLGRNLLDLPLHSRGEASDEMADQWLDVPRALAQRRDADREDIQAIVEIITEAVRFDHLGEVSVRRCHQTNVDPDGPSSADTHELLILENAEELRL